MFNKMIDKLHANEVLRHRHYRGEDSSGPSLTHVRLRFFSSILMLALALIGVVLTDFAPHFASRYWFYAVPIFAIINIVLSWHAAFGHKEFILAWHELLHWLGLLIGIFIVYIFLHLGVLSDVVSGLFMLTLLALTTYLAGVHFDSMLIVIGVILLLFDILSAVFVEFSTVIIIPLIVIAAVLVFWRARGHKKRMTTSSDHQRNRSVVDDIPDDDDDEDF